MSGLPFSSIGAAAAVLIFWLGVGYVIPAVVSVVLLAQGKRSPAYSKAMIGLTLLLMLPLPVFGALFEQGPKALLVFAVGLLGMAVVSAPSLALAYAVGRPPRKSL